MGLGHSPRIVTDGLVLALDAGNVKSNSEISVKWNNVIADATTVSSVGVITCLSVVHTGNRFFGIDYVADCTQGGTKTFDNRPPSVANMNTILDNMANCKEYQTGTYNSTGAVFGAYPDAFHACTLRFTGFGVGAVIGIGGYFTNTDRQCRLTGDLANSPVTITSPSGGFVDPIVLTSDPADIQFGNYETTGGDPWYIYWIGPYNQVPYIIRDNPGYVIGATYSSDDGGTLVFDGTDDYVDLPDSNDFAVGTSGDITIEAWINSDDWSGDSGYVCLYHCGDLIGLSIMFALGRLRLQNNSTEFSLGSTTLSTGQWYHIVAVRKDGILTGYVNGSVENAGVSNTVNFSQNGPRIGQWKGTSLYHFDGKISNFKIYKNKGLTAAEVLQNYNALKGRYA